MTVREMIAPGRGTMTACLQGGILIVTVTIVEEVEAAVTVEAAAEVGVKSAFETVTGRGKETGIGIETEIVIETGAHL